MSSWAEQTVAVKQIQNYVDLERRVQTLLQKETIIDYNLKNNYFIGNAPANHINSTFSSGSLWFVLSED